MGILKYLGEFGEWLQRESACPPNVTDGVTALPSPPSMCQVHAGDEPLGRFLRLQPPGGLDASSDLDAERAPLLLSFKRHRRIPINWLAVVEGSPNATGYAADELRRRIETLWLMDEDAAHLIPKESVVKVEAKNYCVRLFYPAGLLEKHLFVEVDIPEGSLLVQEKPRKDRIPKLYALIPEPAKKLEPGSLWSDVSECVEIFERGYSNEDWAGQIATILSESLKGASSDWPLDPSSLPILSSRISARALSGRMNLEWQNEQVKDLLHDKIFRYAAAGAGVNKEAYWRANEDQRQTLLKNEKGSLGEFLINRASNEPKFLEPLKEGEWVIKCRNRRYCVDFRSSLSAAEKAGLDLTDSAQYATAWEKHIKGLIPLAWSADPNASTPEWIPFAYMQSLDLSPQLIMQEFARKKAAYDVAVASAELGDAILAKIKEMVDRDPEYVRAQAEHARVLKFQTFQPTSRILALKQRAAKLGYQLATGFTLNGLADNEVLVPIGPGKFQSKKVEIGRLYTAVEQVATYAVTQSEYVTNWGIGPFNPFNPGGIGIPGISLPGLSQLGNILSGLGIVGGGLGGLLVPGLPVGGLPFPGIPGLGIGPTQQRREYLVNVSVRYTDLREVNVEIEPWEGLRQQLEQAGFKCLMAELSDQGYVVEGGVPLREVLARCLVDEAYRQLLAVFVPVYQQSLEEGLVRVRYVVVVRPEAGSEPSSFPTIYCEEDLSYKAEWRGTELGELLNSISLAPGEEREVTISRTIERKTEHIDAITAALDITKTDRLDLQNSIQDTISKEQNTKDTSNWNVSANASIGFFSGGGGGGGTHESSVRDFAESIKKSAMQSTREMRVNQKQEIKTSTTTSTAVSSSESTKSSFRNINQGRTLNVQFYQVNNIYKAGLVVEKLRLTYVPAVELIQGLGIHDTLTFELRDLGALLACSNNDSALTGGYFVYDVPSLERRILRTVVRTILREYAEADNPIAEPPAVNERARSVNLRAVSEFLGQSAKAFGIGQDSQSLLGHALGFLQDSLAHTDILNDSLRYSSTLDECQVYVRILEQLYSKGQVLDPHVLTAPSAATYADAEVGILPSTEPYSESMREAELELKYADIQGRLADAAVKRSLAGLRSSRRAIVNATLDRQPRGKLRIEVSPPLEGSDWFLFCDRMILGQLRLTDPSGSLEFAPTGEQDWPRDGGHSWILVSSRLGERLQLPIA